MKKSDWKQAHQVLMFGALAAVVLAGVGYLGYDFWLASTQWLLIAVFLALFAVYAKLNS